MTFDTRQIPEGQLAYVVLHEDHGVVWASPSVDEALAEAKRIADEVGGCYSLDSAPVSGEPASSMLAAAAANPPASVVGAFEATGLPRLSQREVMKLRPEEALATWAYLMPSVRREKGKDRDVVQWQDVDKVTGFSAKGRGVLRQNYKMEKSEGVASGAYSIGLSLLPAKSIFRGYMADDRRMLLPMADRATGGTTLCAFSTDECRAACLTFSGQVTNHDYNTMVKQGTTLALLRHPAAFVRVLVEACRNHFQCSGSYFPYVRLNVLSDIPWELFTPWLFKMFPGRNYKGRKHAFYDYTKIPGRVTPENYDLTFSYASTDPVPHAAAMREVAHGRRLAVVFLLPGKHRKNKPLPREWFGLPVVDGDEHDVRPREPGGVIVGLRYKSTYTVATKDVQKKGALPKFVQRAKENPPVVASVVRARKLGGQLVVDQTPRQTGVIPWR